MRDVDSFDVHGGLLAVGSRRCLPKYRRTPPSNLGTSLFKIGLPQRREDGARSYFMSRHEHRVTPPDAEPFRVSGYSLAGFRRQADGEWRIEALVVNRGPDPSR